MDMPRAPSFMTYPLICLAVAALPGCGALSTLKDGMKHADCVKADLREMTSLEPSVGFQWQNGRLRSVTVLFPRPYDATSLSELAGVVRTVVVKRFEREPDMIVLSFSVGR